MGFMDKAKKLAEQAQTKLDEVQKQFNEGQSGAKEAPPAPAVEYDQHGRPIRTEPPAESAPPPAEPAPPPAEAATPPHGDPLADRPASPPPAPAGEEDDRGKEYEPPKLTGGDPLR